MIFTNRIDIFEENRRLREELEQEKRLRSDWQNKYYEVIKELKEVKAMLRQFLNENTPSSKLPSQVKTSLQDRPKNGTNPRGKPPGSPGGTNEFPEKFDRTSHAKVCKRCKRCKRPLQIETYSKPFFEMKQIEIEFVEGILEEGYCPDCDEFYFGTNPEIPLNGLMGPNLLSFLTEIRHNFAGSYDRTSEFLKSLSGFSFSPAAILESNVRVAEELQPSYDKLEEELPKTNYSYSDETSWPVNGMQWYLWLFITANFAFITIQNSRARRVLTDLFGEKYMGVIISDCMKSYQKFARELQKCWIHLLRKVKFEAKNHPKKNLKKLYECLFSLYQEMADFLDTNPSIKLREEKKEVFEKRLNQIINYKHWCKEVKDIIDNWLIAYRNHWLTAITVPGIRLDNNIDERGIRKVIPTRKLLGGHRTIQGSKNFAIIETHRQTWKLQGKSSFLALNESLRHYNEYRQPIFITERP